MTLHNHMFLQTQTQCIKNKVCNCCWVGKR